MQQETALNTEVVQPKRTEGRVRLMLWNGQAKVFIAGQKKGERLEVSCSKIS